MNLEFNFLNNPFEKFYSSWCKDATKASTNRMFENIQYMQNYAKLKAKDLFKISNTEMGVA